VKLLDTTFLVDVLRRHEAARKLILEMEAAGERGATTEVNAFELFVGTYRRGRAVSERFEGVRKILDRLEVLPLERSGAGKAAELLAKLRADGRDIGLLDALVAGIALAAGCDTIVTRDESFRRTPGLRVQTY
jgi:tRNA(fMet)-specific endonuclease VapC